MERHRQRERVTGGQARDSRDHSSRPIPHTSSHKPSRAHKEVPKSNSHRDPFHAKLPKEITAKPLSGDDDYVRKWLAHTDNFTDPDHGTLKAPETDKDEREIRQSAHVKPKNRLAPQEEETLPPIRKRKRHTSSDSSILAEPTKPKLQQRGGKQDSQEQRGNQTNHFHKKPRTISSESGSSDPFADESPRKETFEKRARHKTREDKYEPKTGGRKAKKGGAARNSRKKSGKSDRRKVVKKSGEELMNNFSSKSISKERLTVRPPQGLGLFNNGRASSPVRRRGLSDLAFSEMNFLQHANRQPQVEHISKSREKEKRKAARAQHEITEFFRPNRRALQETEPNHRRQSSSTIAAEKKSSVYVRQVERENQQQSHEDFRSLDSRERPFVGVRQSAPSSDRLSTRRSLSPSIADPRRGYELANRASEKATTYISWSETQLSPTGTSHRQTSVNRTLISPTPESVWRSIQNTGVYKDTGIERNPGGALGHQRPSSRLSWTDTANPQSISVHHEHIRKSKKLRPIATSNNRAYVPYQNEKSASLTRNPSSPPEQVRRTPRQIINSEGDQREQNDGTTTRRRVIIEQFDPEHGWHETPNIPIRNVPSDQPRELKSAPVDRQDLAKAARIKRPSTTLPLSRVDIAEKKAVNYLRAVDQSMKDRGVTSRNEHQSLHSVNQAFSKDEVDNQHSELGQAKRRDNTPEQPAQEQKEIRMTSRLGRELHDFGKSTGSFVFDARQQISTNNTIQEVSANDDGTRYLGLPIRGSWRPLQVYQQRLPTSVPDQQPYFLRQMNQEGETDHQNVVGYPRLTDCEIYGIAEEGEYEYHGLPDDFVVEDLLSGNYEPDTDVGIEMNDYDLSNIQLGTQNRLSYSGGENPESHHADADGRTIYQHDTIMDEVFLSPELEAPFQVSEQGYHELHDQVVYDQMQGLW